MTEFYSINYYQSIMKKKNDALKVYAFVSLIFVFMVVLLMILYANEPYGTSLRTPFLIVLIAITVIFVGYSFVFFVITYGRLKKYCFYLYYAVFGSKESAKVTILNYDLTPKDNGGIDFYTLNVLIWSDTDNNYVERTIYVDAEFTIEDIKINQILTVELNGNYLVAYQKEN